MRIGLGIAVSGALVTAYAFGRANFADAAPCRAWVDGREVRGGALFVSKAGQYVFRYDGCYYAIDECGATILSPAPGCLWGKHLFSFDGVIMQLEPGIEPMADWKPFFRRSRSLSSQGELIEFGDVRNRRAAFEDLEVRRD